MSEYKEIIHDTILGTITERDYTAKEIQEAKALEAESLALAKQNELRAIAKATLLKKLGITAEEAALLLS